MMAENNNVNTKGTDKLSKYKDLDIVISRLWKVKTKIVPVTNGALGTNKNRLYHNL
jgi:hypothetical protein